VLVDAAPTILPEIPTRLGEYAARQLTGRGIDIRIGTTLESVEEDSLVLSDGSCLETHTLVWTAGVRAHPLPRRVRPPLDERGRVRVDDTLRVAGRGNVCAWLFFRRDIAELSVLGHARGFSWEGREAAPTISVTSSTRGGEGVD